MPPDPVISEDEDYASSEDSDFAPDQGLTAGTEASDSDSDDEQSSKQRRAAVPETEGAGYDNSGDEAIIKRGKKRRNKVENGDDEAGGDGGLIKTRRQKAVEKEERRYHQANNGPVTVDVDALWEQMMSGKTATIPAEGTSNDMDVDKDAQAPEKKTNEPPTDAGKEEPSMIRIKRTYNFAGQVHTEEKLVPRDSAEAQLFLSSGEQPIPDDGLPAKRTTRKAFRSAFEPLTDPLPQRGDLNLGMAARQKESRDAAAKKLNTVEKSRMDWAGFVDKEGIKDDLELAGRSKGAFNDREAFLARSEAIRDEEAKRVRMAARA